MEGVGLLSYSDVVRTFLFFFHVPRGVGDSNSSLMASANCSGFRRLPFGGRWLPSSWSVDGSGDSPWTNLSGALT